MDMTSILLRPPTFSSARPLTTFKPPTVSWLTGTWHVVNSTLPTWKNKRNVQIKYTPLPAVASSAGDETDQLDDEVTYQGLNHAHVWTIHGTDTASNASSRGEWDWRGRGLLYIASSHWEVLGYGDEAQTGNRWIVTMFAKTLFTPAGIDIYSRDRGGLQEATLSAIKTALALVDDTEVRSLAGKLFEVRMDSERD